MVDLNHVGVIVGIIAGVLAILAAMWKLARVATRVEAVIGRDADGRTLNDQLGEVRTRMAKVEHQLWPNGGSSLADKVNRQETQLQQVADATAGTGKILDKLWDSIQFGMVYVDPSLPVSEAKSAPPPK